MIFKRDTANSSVSPEGYRITLYRVSLESIYVAWKSREKIHVERGTFVSEDQARDAFTRCKDACVGHHKSHQFKRKHKGG
jgi:hypothetical protein